MTHLVGLGCFMDDYYLEKVEFSLGRPPQTRLS